MKRSRVWLLCLLPVAGCDLDLTGIGFDCDFDRDLFEASSVAGADRVRVVAEAGDLRVEGVAGLNEVRVRGRACAQDARDLDDVDLVVQRSGSTVRVISLVAPSGGRLDLIVEVPDWMLVEVDDESGDLDVANVVGVSIFDGSGDITVEDIAGDVDINDGSGDIRVENVLGDLRVDFDSSGRIDYRNVRGRILIPR